VYVKVFQLAPFADHVAVFAVHVATTQVEVVQVAPVHVPAAHVAAVHVAPSDPSQSACVVRIDTLHVPAVPHAASVVADWMLQPVVDVHVADDVIVAPADERTEHAPAALQVDSVVSEFSEQVPVATHSACDLSEVAPLFVHTPIAKQAVCDELAEEMLQVPIAVHASWLDAAASLQVPTGTLSDT